MSINVHSMQFTENTPFSGSKTVLQHIHYLGKPSWWPQVVSVPKVCKRTGSTRVDEAGKEWFEWSRATICTVHLYIQQVQSPLLSTRTFNKLTEGGNSVRVVDIIKIPRDEEYDSWVTSLQSIRPTVNDVPCRGCVRRWHDEHYYHDDAANPWECTTQLNYDLYSACC